MTRRNTLTLGELQADVIRKDIKHVHLSVYPPDGHVRISAPMGMALDTIRVYAITKLDWIKSQQRKLRAQERETIREYLNRESHYLWGRRYLLKIVEADAVPSVKLRHNSIELHVRPGSDVERKHILLESWYREKLRAEIPALLAKWQPILGVKPARVLVQRMKTKWGSCNPDSGNVRLNTDLARKPPACLEYIFVHELAHLLEPSHNARFQSLMDQVMPHWRQIRHELNQLPVRHEAWEC
ncbi:MAG: SprT family zinc-dependent metalloprotease [Thermomonas sp.]|uniref:M48 family metallopeptidase n=1 Tax=Thermomonas sp. TaxID=1971895 RepID=UPI0039E28B11